jgi:prophage regulatory protein
MGVFCRLFLSGFLKRGDLLMTDNGQNNLDNLNNASPAACVPQQDAGYARLAVVAPPASCDVQSVSPSAIKVLRLPEVMARIGLCRASLYLYINKGSFPKQISIGPRAVGWLEHEIDAWLTARIQTRRASKA